MERSYLCITKDPFERLSMCSAWCYQTLTLKALFGLHSTTSSNRTAPKCQRGRVAMRALAIDYKRTTAETPSCLLLVDKQQSQTSILLKHTISLLLVP